VSRPAVVIKISDHLYNR